MFTIKGKYNTATIMIDDVEESCVAQITLFVNHPTFTNKIVIMPDTHAGKGAVIGFTMPLSNMIIPNVIGVDIGCGMFAVKLEGNYCTDPEIWDQSIRSNIPLGHNVNEKSIHNLEKHIEFWKTINQKIKIIEKKFNCKISDYGYDYRSFKESCQRIGVDLKYALNSLGSLGGGNHFIEVAKSTSTNHHWIIIHSGSRNYGKCVADYWQKIAKKNQRFIDINEIIRNTKNKKDIQGNIQAAKNQTPRKYPDELEALEDQKDIMGYLVDMVVAQTYAQLNRLLMSEKCLQISNRKILQAVECIHNYISFDDHLMIRKGAIDSSVGTKVLIPLNMRDGSLLCVGKGNSNWNYSAPHGAGRIMSRGEAKKSITLDEFETSMKGIFSNSIVAETLDEAPMAYKDSKLIEESITNTVDIIDRLIPIHNIKA